MGVPRNFLPGRVALVVWFFGEVPVTERMSETPLYNFCPSPSSDGSYIFILG
jgi:hypothetical protein